MSQQQAKLVNLSDFPFISDALTGIPYQSHILIVANLEPNTEYEVSASGSPGHCIDAGSHLTGDFVQSKVVISNEEGVVLIRAKVNSSDKPLTETVCFVTIAGEMAAFRVTTASILPIDNSKRYINTETKQLLTENEIRLQLQNSSLPTVEWTDELLNPLGYACINRIGLRPVPAFEEKVIDGEPYEEQGRWFLPWDVVPLGQGEIINKRMEQRAMMVVSPFQAKAALHRAGLLDEVEQLIDAAETEMMIKLAWKNATEFRRLSPVIQTLGNILELSEQQIDDLFTDAQSIQI